MMKTLLWGSLALFCVAPAFASSPEPSDKEIARAAQTCTAQGAFGHKFGESITMASQHETDVAPFEVKALASAGHSSQVYRISASASFAKAPMSGEDRIALSDWYFRKLDAEIAARRSYAQRSVRSGIVTFSFHEGFEIELSRDGTEVWLSCTDQNLHRRLLHDLRRTP